MNRLAPDQRNVDVEAIERDVRAELALARSRRRSAPLTRAFASMLANRRDREASAADDDRQRGGRRRRSRSRAAARSGSDASIGASRELQRHRRRDRDAAAHGDVVERRRATWRTDRRRAIPRSDRATVARTAPRPPRAPAGPRSRRAQARRGGSRPRSRSCRGCCAGGSGPASGPRRRAPAPRSRSRRARRTCPPAGRARPATTATAPAPTAGPRRSRARSGAMRATAVPETTPRGRELSRQRRQERFERQLGERQRHVALESRRLGREAAVDRDRVDQPAARAHRAFRLGRDGDRAAAERVSRVADVRERELARQRRQSAARRRCAPRPRSSPRRAATCRECRADGRSGNWRMPTSSASRPDRAMRPATISALVARAAQRQVAEGDAVVVDAQRRVRRQPHPLAEHGHPARVGETSTSSARSLVGPARVRAERERAAREVAAADQAFDLDAAAVQRQIQPRRRQPVALVRYPTARCAPRPRSVPPHIASATRGTLQHARRRASRPESRTTVAPAGGRGPTCPRATRPRGGPVSPSVARDAPACCAPARRRRRSRSARTCSMPSSVPPANGRSAAGSSARAAKRRARRRVASSCRRSSVASASRWPPSGDASDRWSTRTRPACGSATT